MRKKIILIASFSLVFDQIIKYLFSNVISGFVLIPNFISFIYAENEGVAFSMLSGNRLFIILITILLLGILIYMLEKEHVNSNQNLKLLVLSYGFLFGGILGNLVDRIIRGYVVDYISLNIIGYHFPIFNLADLFITLGVILLVIKTIKEEQKHKN